MKSKYVVGFCFNVDNSMVALIRKQKPDWQKGFLNGIGGKIEHGEDAHQAMRREFEEETGTGVFGWGQFAVMEGEDWIVYCFFSMVSNQIFDSIKSTEEEEVEKCAVSDLGNLKTISNLQWLIPMALDYSQMNYKTTTP